MPGRTSYDESKNAERHEGGLENKGAQPDPLGAEFAGIKWVGHSRRKRRNDAGESEGCSISLRLMAGGDGSGFQVATNMHPFRLRPTTHPDLPASCATPVWVA